MDKIKNIIGGLMGKTGMGVLTLALSAILSQYDVGSAEIAAGIGAAQVIIGILHKILKNYKAK